MMPFLWQIGIILWISGSAIAARAEDIAPSQAAGHLVEEMLNMPDLEQPAAMLPKKEKPKSMPPDMVGPMLPAPPASPSPPAPALTGDLITDMLNLPDLDTPEETEQAAPVEEAGPVPGVEEEMGPPMLLPLPQPAVQPALETPPAVTQEVKNKIPEEAAPTAVTAPVETPMEKKEKKTLAEEAAEIEENIPEGEKLAVPAPKQAVLMPQKGVDVFWSGSLMYNEADFRKLQDAIAAYERLVRNATGKNGATTTMGSAPEQPASTFFLNSIVYVSEKSWTIWLNNKKYIAGKADEQLKVAEVQSDRVHLVWKPSQPLMQLVPGWQERLTEIGNGDYISANRRIWVPGSADEVHFILQPNQTFNPQDMKITEGASGS